MRPVRVVAVVFGIAMVLISLAIEASAQPGRAALKKQGVRPGASDAGPRGGMGGMMGSGMGPMGGGQPMLQGQRTGGLQDLLAEPTIQDELKLSDAQRTRLRRIREGQDPSIIEMNLNRRNRINDARGMVRPAEMRQQRAELEMIVLGVLDARQAARLHQLDLQVEGLAALLRPEVAGRLNLNNGQFSEVQSVSGLLRLTRAEHNAARNRLIASLLNTQAGDRIDYNEVKAKVDDTHFRAAVEKLNAEADENSQMHMVTIKRILNERQWAIYAPMLGEPFDQSRLTRRNTVPFLSAPPAGTLVGPRERDLIRGTQGDRPSPTVFARVDQDRAPVAPNAREAGLENVDSVAFSPDGRIIAAGYYGGGRVDPGVALWDAAGGKRTGAGCLALNEGWVRCVAFSTDGKTIAAGYHTKGGPVGGVMIWDVAAGNGVPGASFTVNDGDVVSVAYSPDGKTLAAGYGINGKNGGGVGLWDTATRTLRGGEPFFVNEGAVVSVAFSPDGQIMAAGYQPGGMRNEQSSGVLLFETKAGKRLVEQALLVDEGQVTSVAFCPDGKTLAAGIGGTRSPGRGPGGGVLLWDASTHARLDREPLGVSEGRVVSIAVSPDSKTIAAGFSTPGTKGPSGVVLWDVAARNRRPADPLDVHEGNVVGVAFSPDGKKLAAGYTAVGAGGVLLWNVATGKRRDEQPLVANERGAGEVAVAPRVRAD